jgi:hypothetical protein
MNSFSFLSLLWIFAQAMNPSTENPPLEKSAYFAFVDREYIFTIEMVKPGAPMLNFISMTDQDVVLPARNIRLGLENRSAVVKFYTIETGAREPMAVSTITMHPRSYFGFQLNGDFGDAKELFGASIKLGAEDVKLVPLKRFDFETLAAKVSRINLGSPDFNDDWRVLKLESMGTRSRTRK